MPMQGTITEREGSVQLIYFYFRSAPFDIENNYLLPHKTSYPIEEVNRREPSPSVTVPWFIVNLLKISL
jgi:hypothetical protein